MPDNTLTTREAAARLEIRPQTLTRAILRKALKAELRAGRYFIEEAEVERYARERRGRGRPKKTRD